MSIIFLDFDGVINSDKFHRNEIFNGRDFTVDDQLIVFALGPAKLLDAAAIQHLKKICDTTASDIVITSTWRLHFSEAEIIALFKDNGWHNPPIVGMTPNLSSLALKRGDEINRWLRENNKQDEAYIILDDVNDFHCNQRDKLFLTNIETGLLSEHIPTIIQMIYTECESLSSCNMN